MLLLGRELTLSGEKNDAAVLIGRFTRLGADSAEDFKQKFFGRCADLDTALDNVNAMSAPYFDSAVKRAGEVLKSRGITEYDVESLIQLFIDKGFFDLWNDTLGEFLERNSEIEAEKPAEPAVAKAQVYNLLKQYLPKALSDTIRSFASAIMPIITEKTGTTFAPPTTDEIIRSKEIYNRVLSGKIPEADRTDAIFEAITLNPNNADAFYFFVLKYGDVSREIEKAGEEFGNPIHKMKVEGFINYQKKAFKQKALSFAELEDDAYLKELNAIKVGLFNIRKNLGISPETFTWPEKNLLEAIKECEEGRRIRGKEKDALLKEPEPKTDEITPKTPKTPEAPKTPETSKTPETPKTSEAPKISEAPLDDSIESPKAATTEETTAETAAAIEALETESSVTAEAPENKDTQAAIEALEGEDPAAASMSEYISFEKADNPEAKELMQAIASDRAEPSESAQNPEKTPPEVPEELKEEIAVAEASQASETVAEATPLSETLQKVKDICLKFKKEASVPGLYEPSKKLVKHLELNPNEEIFMGQDKTIFNSGKEGFAITSHGIICVTHKTPERTTFKELSSVNIFEWANPNFKYELLADDETLLRCLPSDKDDILGLMATIKQAVS